MPHDRTLARRKPALWLAWLAVVIVVLGLGQGLVVCDCAAGLHLDLAHAAGCCADAHDAMVLDSAGSDSCCHEPAADTATDTAARPPAVFRGSCKDHDLSMSAVEVQPVACAGLDLPSLDVAVESMPPTPPPSAAALPASGPQRVPRPRPGLDALRLVVLRI